MALVINILVKNVLFQHQQTVIVLQLRMKLRRDHTSCLSIMMGTYVIPFVLCFLFPKILVDNGLIIPMMLPLLYTHTREH